MSPSLPWGQRLCVDPVDSSRSALAITKVGLVWFDLLPPYAASERVEVVVMVTWCVEGEGVGEMTFEAQIW